MSSFITRIKSYRQSMFPLAMLKNLIYRPQLEDLDVAITHCGLNASSISDAMPTKAIEKIYKQQISIDKYLRNGVLYRISWQCTNPSRGHAFCYAVFENKYYLFEASYKDFNFIAKEITKDELIAHFEVYNSQLVNPSDYMWIKMYVILSDEEILGYIKKQYTEYLKNASEEEKATCF